MKPKNKMRLRTLLREALANRQLADDIFDAIQELQGNVNARDAKLDSDTGVSDTDYAAKLDVKKNLKG